MNLETVEIKKQLVTNYIRLFPDEAAGELGKLPISEVCDYLESQTVSNSSAILVRLDNFLISEIISGLSDAYFKKLFDFLDPYTGAIILSKLETEDVKYRLDLLPEKLKSEIEEILTYPPDSAGYLMDSRIIFFHPENTVGKVLEKLRLHRDRKVYNIYIIDHNGFFEGRIPIQVIAISAPEIKLKELIESSFSVHAMSPREEVVEILKNNNILSLPVIDSDNRLLGIIRHEMLLRAAEQDATEDVQAMFGAGKEEKALSKVGFAIKKRLPWLEINLATAFLAASVVGIFEETIAQITVLAVFLPVVAGQSGNTGSQALAVTIRGLALREIRLTQWLKVARKELAVGFINGVVVALTTSLIVFFWVSSLGLALVIGISMIISMAIAGLSGAVIPIILKSFGQDPAQSSSIVLTTVTDIVGFFSFLGLATLLSSSIGV